MTKLNKKDLPANRAQQKKYDKTLKRCKSLLINLKGHHADIAKAAGVKMTRVIHFMSGRTPTPPTGEMEKLLEACIKFDVYLTAEKARYKSFNRTVSILLK